MSIPVGIPEELAFSTVRIECQLRSGGTSTGTGFFFNYLQSKNTYFPVIVTNRHVVEGAESGTFCLTEADQNGTPRPGKFRKHTVTDFERVWIHHPDPRVDLSVMPIGGLLHEAADSGVRYFFRGFEQDFIPDATRLEKMASLEPVVMVGYPVGIWDDCNNMPVFRKGVAATHPYMDYRGQKEFVVDLACFPGSSGSPVLFVEPVS